jgi:hypothetical protein
MWSQPARGFSCRSAGGGIPDTLPQRHLALFPLWVKLHTQTDGSRKANMARIDDLSDAEFMKLQAEYGDGLPICPICTLEDVRHLILELMAGDAVSDEVKGALAPVLYAVTRALVTDRTIAEQGGGSAHLGGDEDDDDDGALPRTQ